jgi:hypothetical protein
MKKFLNWQEKIFLALLLSIFLLIIFTPLILLDISNNSDKIFIFDEEIAEVIMIFLLFLSGAFIFYLYRQELSKRSRKIKDLEVHSKSLVEGMEESFKYIGRINVQIDEIMSLFSEIKIYPENKKDLKSLLKFFGQKVLSIVDTDWVFLRIVDTAKGKILKESQEVRGSSPLLKLSISLSDLLANKPINDCRYISTKYDNFTLKTFCIFENKKISKDQEVFIKAIINQLEMIFLIFSSNYYENKNVRQE